MSLRNSQNANRAISSTPKLSIKFLVSNAIAGSFIGTGGAAIKELIEVTEARVIASSIQDVYPGTSDRIILIQGSNNSVDLAQNLLWDLLAINAGGAASKTSRAAAVTWSPRTNSETPGLYDDEYVEGKITIPASAAGVVLGRAGATLKSIAEESGASVSMTPKEEALFTQERILSIKGPTGSCAKCVSLILNKLSEDLSQAQYVNRGVTYVAQLPGLLGLNKKPRDGNGASTGAVVDDLVSQTKITLLVPDSLIGNVLGKRGVTIREIMSLSGAKIAVSAR